MYGQWTVGPKNVLRDFQPTDVPTTNLAEDGSNTALIVSKIRHSTDLVNEFSDEPETILISESHEGSSSIRRLDKEKLGSWLTDYSLGDAWRVGALGGTGGDEVLAKLIAATEGGKNGGYAKSPKNSADLLELLEPHKIAEKAPRFGRPSS